MTLDLGEWSCDGQVGIPVPNQGENPVHCRRCRRSLSDETSRARGIGPDCWDYLHGGIDIATRRHDVSTDQLDLLAATPPAAKETAMSYPCSVRDRRAQMDDDEFWHDVAESLQPTVGDDPGDDPDDGRPVDVPGISGPCPECGEDGACAWDALGRPLIHATRSTSEDDQ